MDKLVNSGADVNKRDWKGSSPLALAVANKHTHIACLLISMGAKIDELDKRGLSPLHYAASSGEGNMLEQFFHACKKAKITKLEKIVDNYKRNALFSAVLFGREHNVSFLLKNGFSAKGEFQIFLGKHLLFFCREG